MQGLGLDPSNPEDMKKLFVRSSVSLFAYRFVNILSSLLAVYACNLVTEDLPNLGLPGVFTTVLQGLFYLGGGYYLAEAFFSIIVSLAALYSTIQLQMNPQILLDAIKEFEATGVQPVDSGRGAFNAAAAITKLRSLKDALQAKVGEFPTSSNDTLTELNTFLILERAEKSGYRPADDGLSEEQFMSLARTFCAYDLNSDGCIDSGEFRRLMSELAPALTGEEVADVYKALDSNKNGVIDFVEFARWSADKLPEPSPPTTESARPPAGASK
eukprot:jgi/Mesvir1/27860/Mv07529-RA.1